MNPHQKQILAFLAKPGYQPVKPKVLFGNLGLGGVDYEEFKTLLKDLLRKKQIELSKSHSILAVGTAPAQHTLTGTYRKTLAGHGFVRPTGAQSKRDEIYIPADKTEDAVTGDIVQVKIRRMTKLGPRGEVVGVLERATRQFVGTYFEREGEGFVRVDGTVFAHSVCVGDPGAKGARSDDKVVLEMVRFPGPDDRGEGVITEVLGRRGQPGVDTLSTIKALGLPEEFPEEVLHEARQAAAGFQEEALQGREDFTGWTTITIDPPDAKDFDDAISLTLDPKSKHWLLGVHIADVGHFAPLGSFLDREARQRATSIYLPQKVIPMFPELISNSLASLQQGKVRFVKSVLLDLTPQGQITHVRFANAAIRVKRRFAYEQVTEVLGEETPPPPTLRKGGSDAEKRGGDAEKRGRDAERGGRDAGRERGTKEHAEMEDPIKALYPRGKKAAAKKKPSHPTDAESSRPQPIRGADSHSSPPLAKEGLGGSTSDKPLSFQIEPELVEMLFRMRDLALLLHRRRVKRGALELNMPEVQLEFDAEGGIAGGHFRTHDISHQIIEEFMLMANEAVAGHLDEKGIYFLRRVHPAPDPAKLRSFAQFARILGYKPKGEMDRFTLQRILKLSANQPEVHAVHYALLRSLKQAHYHPEKEEHFALASENYCHFTSPIRRYPDLTVHRLLDQLLRRGRASSSYDEFVATGEHCSKMERRAELAERELVKLKLLTYMSTRLGMEMEVVITGVADYGFFGQAQMVPVEGLVHISTLPDDYYHFEEESYSLIGQRRGHRYRLGDKVMVQAVRVDLQRRQLDFRVVLPKGRKETAVEGEQQNPERQKKRPTKGKGRRRSRD